MGLSARRLPVAEVCFLPGARADYEESLAWYEARSARAAAGPAILRLQPVFAAQFGDQGIVAKVGRDE
jgi:hypothetical protein